MNSAEITNEGIGDNNESPTKCKKDEEKRIDLEVLVSPGKIITPEVTVSSAGVETRQSDFSKRHQRRHFPDRNSSTIFSNPQPQNSDASKDPCDFKKKKSFWTTIR